MTEELLDILMKKSSLKARNGPPPITHLYDIECLGALSLHILANINLYRLIYDQPWYPTTARSSTSPPNQRPSIFGPTRGSTPSSTSSRYAFGRSDVQRSLRAKMGALEESSPENVTQKNTPRNHAK